MKTLRSLMSGIALLFIFAAANAAVEPINDKPTKADVINMYIDAVIHGKTDGLSNVLADNVEYNLHRGDNVNTINKDELINSLKQNAAANETVTTNTTILTDDDDASTIKIEFKYGDYTRTDTVTLSKSNGWLITNVDSSFK